MRVAVILGNQIPSDGGGFTFVEDVVRFVDDYSKKYPNLKFIYFCDSLSANFFKRLFPAVSNFVSISRESTLSRLITKGRRWMPFIGQLWWRKTILERQLNSYDISIAWFVSGSGEVLDIPYVATIWDLQHRTHPWFPEVCSNGEWDAREIGVSSYLRRASIIVTGTEIGAQQIVKYYQVDVDRILILPHPTPSFAIENANLPKKDLPAELSSTPEFFFYPAQYWPHKNHAGLIRAIPKFNLAANNKVKFIFVGSDKGNKKYLQKISRECGVESQVIFLGFVDRSDLITLYKSAIAMVYPSFSGPENLPPLEAFAMGCPVINSNFPGAKEQLGDAALFFDPKSEESISNALVKIYSNDGLRRELIDRGFKRAGEWKAEQYINGVISGITSFISTRNAWGVDGIR